MKKAFFIIFKGLSLKQIKPTFLGRWESDFNNVNKLNNLNKFLINQSWLINQGC